LNRKRNTTCAHANYANWGPGAEVPRLCSSSTEEANIIAGWAPGPHCNGTVQMDALKVPMFCNIHDLIYVLNMSKSQQIIFTCIILTCEKLSNWPPSGSKWLFKKLSQSPKILTRHRCKLWNSGWSWRSLYAGIGECMVSVYETMLS
jgi:hypothetical protein